MKLERGIVTHDLRLRLTLQSEDVESHSMVSDNPAVFDEMMDAAQAVFLKRLAEWPRPPKQHG